MPPVPEIDAAGGAPTVVKAGQIYQPNLRMAKLHCKRLRHNRILVPVPQDQMISPASAEEIVKAAGLDPEEAAGTAHNRHPQKLENKMGNRLKISPVECGLEGLGHA